MTFNTSTQTGKKSEKKTNQRWLTGGLLLSCAATGYFLLSRLEMVMPFTQIPQVLCVPTCADTQAIHPATAEIQSDQWLNASQSLSSLLGESASKEKVSLLIEKSQHRVTVFYELEPVKAYEAVFGTAPTGDPTGDKRQEGDRKTPEGIFRIRDLYPHDEWSKFIWLDYPTPQSWRRHLRAKLTGEVGLLSTVGSEIGIHGVPEGADGLIDTRSNWTWGCISLKNADVNEIY
ncbi:MAG: L,D-transpeptidase, partial [Cyanobacteria bacterium J06560_2]